MPARSLRPHGSHAPDRHLSAIGGLLAPEHLLVPRTLLRAVEDHQMALRGAATPHVPAKLIHTLGDRALKPVPPQLALHRLPLALLEGPTRPAGLNARAPDRTRARSARPR